MIIIWHIFDTFVGKLATFSNNGWEQRSARIGQVFRSGVSEFHHVHSVSFVTRISHLSFCVDRIRHDRSQAIFAKRVRAHPVVLGLRFYNVRCDAVESTIEWQQVSKNRCEKSGDSENVHALHFLEFDVLSSELSVSLMSPFIFALYLCAKKAGALENPIAPEIESTPSNEWSVFHL